MYISKRTLIVLLLVLIANTCLFAQRWTLNGFVLNEVTGLPIGYASVFIKGTTRGAMTSAQGTFTLEVQPGRELIISCLGYVNDTINTSDLDRPNHVFELEPLNYELAEVIVKPKKEKYKKKGNPAVEFVEKIIANRDEGDPKDEPYYSYQRYEKLTYGLNNFDSIQQEKWLFRKFNFLKEYVDTSEISGLPILAVSTKEIIEDNYTSTDPNRHKKRVVAFKSSGIDEMLPEEALNQFFSEAFKEVDIFDNNINLLFTRFVSPISSIGPSFYKYYLLDTVQIDGRPHMDLGFVPFVSESTGFTGHLYVDLDSTYFIRKVKLNVPQDINLNFVDQMTIDQEFERTPDGKRLLTRDDITIEFKVYQNTRGIYAKRINSYKYHSFDPPENMAFFEEADDNFMEDGAKYQDEKYWAEHRHIKIKKNENNVDRLLERMRDVSLFYYTEKLISMIVSGYIPTNADPELSKFNIGPINTIISGNSFEGARFRLGGMTTPALNKHWFGQGYVAYGTRDKKVKYKGQVEYSFSEREQFVLEYPIHSIRASYMYDIDQLGQQYEFTNKDNIVMSLKRMADDRNLYLRKAEVSYQREHYNGFSYELALRNKISYATSDVQFKTVLPNGTSYLTKDYMMTEAELKLRYAPGEKFYQMHSRRIPLTRYVPIFNLSHITSRKGFLGSDYTLNRTDLSFEKRTWFSAYGYLDTYVKASKVWNKVPFPMLILPNANLTYIITPQSYALMNPLEFVSDQSVSWEFTYYLNGLIFNRVPLLKILQWRELVAFRGFYGTLSDKNNPFYNTDLFEFPERAGVLGHKPYMEMAIGIENIFKLLRVDYVWRLTYRNQPHIDKRGVRIRMQMKF